MAIVKYKNLYKMPSYQNNLKNTLDSLGLTQTELSLVAKVAIGTVNKVCNMRYNPAPKTKNRLIIGLNSLVKKDFLVEEIFPD